MMPSIKNVCAEIITGVVEIKNGALDATAAHERICAMFDAAIKTRGQLPDNAEREFLYPLAAFADEILMGVSEYRHYWAERMIQMRYFGEAAAGAVFFTKLEALVDNVAKKNHAARNGGLPTYNSDRESNTDIYTLELYYACMSLGFRGMYGAVGMRKFEEIYERAGKALVYARRKERKTRTVSEPSTTAGRMAAWARAHWIAACLTGVSALALATAAAVFLTSLVMFTRFFDNF